MSSIQTSKSIDASQAAFGGFPYKASELNRFIYGVGLFTIMLKDGSIIHHTPKEPKEFLQWIEANGVMDVREL